MHGTLTSEIIWDTATLGELPSSRGIPQTYLYLLLSKNWQDISTEEEFPGAETRKDATLGGW